MTKAPDLREIIAEQSSSPIETRALEQTADLLAETLAVDVPYRPQFKTELRRKLMAEAHRTLSPWYRRPAFVYSSVAVAAAVAVLAVGLKLWNAPASPDKQLAAGPAPATTQATPVTPGSEPVPPTAPRQVNARQFPPVALTEQPLAPEDPGPAPVAGVDLKSVAVYLLTTRPDSAQFGRIARGMDFVSATSLVGPTGYQAVEGARTLTMTSDGFVVYKDDAKDPVSDPPVMLDFTAVRTAAQNFLVRASLPVPGLEPQVIDQPGENQHHAYVVTYTPSVGGLPVVNGRTIIRMTDRYRVFSAEAYVQAGQELNGSFSVIPPSEAIARAQERGGGTFSQADLAYARTSGDGATYLQPVWRVFGTNAGGQRVVRYVPALAAQ